uniref:Uncharacterized protein n=1 Tax=Tetraselmis sp. GSL018 TaxID=582737 RepID=A0A061RY51_9CHLO
MAPGSAAAASPGAATCPPAPPRPPPCRSSWNRRAHLPRALPSAARGRRGLGQHHPRRRMSKSSSAHRSGSTARPARSWHQTSSAPLPGGKAAAGAASAVPAGCAASEPHPGPSPWRKQARALTSCPSARGGSARRWPASGGRASAGARGRSRATHGCPC